MGSIQHRVLLALLAAGLVPLAIIFVTTHTVVQSAIVGGEKRALMELNRELARNVAVSMEKAANDLQSLSTNPFLADVSSNEEQIRAEMQRMVEVYDLFSDISYYDRNGFLIESTDREIEPGYREYTPEFKEALAGRPSISTPIRKLGAEGLFLTVYLPVYEERETVRAVIKARLSFERVATLLDNVHIGENGHLVLLDQWGNVIASPFPDRVLHKFDDTVGVLDWAQDPVGRYVTPAGARFYYAATVLSAKKTHVGSPWTLLALKPDAEVGAALGQTRSFLVLALLVTVGVATGLTFFLSRRITTPLVRASEVAMRVASEILDARLEEAGPLELRTLAVSFNKMVRELKGFRDRLESLVDSRTRKLRESQRELEDLTAQLRATYESAQEAILVCGHDGRILAANARLAEFFGLDLDTLEDLDFHAFTQQAQTHFEPPFDAAPGERWSFYQSLPETSGEAEWTLTGPLPRVVSTYTAPVLNREGESLARLWMFRDISETRELEESLRQAQKLEAVGRLAGGVAHDFNNLLTGIIGNLSLAEMENVTTPNARLAGDAPKYIGSAKKAAERAADLVKQLLGFSRRSHLRIGPCAVNDVIEEVNELIIHSFDPRICLVLNCDPDLWSVNADSTLIQQVIMNLGVNAKDAMDEGGGEIRFETRNVTVSENEADRMTGAAPGDYVRISVSDSGCGMTSEVLGKIFEPFFTTKEQGKGTGLGLATSYGIVRQHGGWLTCRSGVGEGTTFAVYLPRADEPVASVDDDATQNGRATQGGDELVLLVDDEDVVRSVAEGVLRQFGYQTLCASDGWEALAICEERGHDIDLVLLDLTMPKLSGRDTFKQMRLLQPDLPVVICSGYLVDIDEFEQEAGTRPNGFVQKPYRIEDLAGSVREVLDNPALALI